MITTIITPHATLFIFVHSHHERKAENPWAQISHRKIFRTLSQTTTIVTLETKAFGSCSSQT
jgi:hypothetical protein